MNWYGGNISEAVNLSKTTNSVFVVFVEGKEWKYFDAIQTNHVSGFSLFSILKIVYFYFCFYRPR